jgi:hypothetical protein
VGLPKRSLEALLFGKQNIDNTEENSEKKKCGNQPSSISTSTTAKPTPATDSPLTTDDSQTTSRNSSQSAFASLMAQPHPVARLGCQTNREQTE